MYFSFIGVKKIVRYIEASFYRGSLNRDSTVAS